MKRSVLKLFYFYGVIKSISHTQTFLIIFEVIDFLPELKRIDNLHITDTTYLKSTVSTNDIFYIHINEQPLFYRKRHHILMLYIPFFSKTI